MHNWSLSRYSSENSVALISEKGKERSDFRLCRNDSFAESSFCSTLHIFVFGIGLLFDWRKLMFVTLELLVHLSYLLFLEIIRIALISNKVDCFDVQSQVLENIYSGVKSH